MESLPPDGRNHERIRETTQMDSESSTWVGDLRATGQAHDRAVGRLHELLLRVARAEAARRRSRLPDNVTSELDDLCTQAASDATMAVMRKLDSFRGTARFTTWACKFAILELSARVRRRTWRGRTVQPDAKVWDRLADSRPTVHEGIEHLDLLAALRRAVETDLTERQRFVFHSAALDDVPIDVLAERLQSSRGAIYKMLHDSRRKIRASLTAAGYLESLAS